MIGTLLANRYRIDAQLAEGGMGVVYRAHDTVLDRPVAIKTLYQALFGEEGLKRLIREARAAAGLQHPNIVAIYDVLEDVGTPAIVMEFVRGKTLRELGPPLERLAEITAEILDALAHAHAHGIVHRDIKPENIMVTEGGRVKVMDFGLARSEGRSRLTQTGLIVGTVAYMAPEQALGGALDGRTDLYALGCVLYELATGRRPFESEDPISVISQHLSIPPVAPRWYKKELPPDWEGVILKLMAKDPAERYASAAEARRAFAALRPATLEDGAVAEGELPASALLGTVQRGRLVARDAELRELKGYVDLAISGQGQLVTLAGEPGIGKTRLAREGLIYARLRGCRIFAGACYEQEGGVPYLPFVEGFQDYLKATATGQVADEAGESGPELVKIIPDLAVALPGLVPSPPLEETHERLRLYDAVADFFVRLSRRAPAVLMLDDLHWADGATLQLLRHLSRRLRGERILLVGTYRDVELDRQHPLADLLRDMNRERLYQRILLRRLNTDGVRAMIASMFGVDQVSEEFGALIYRETEGNPFFVEEVLKHLVESGAIYREEGRWQRKEIAEIEVPQSVKEVIGRRLEQVSDACRQTLTIAAVIGKRFDFDVLVRTAEATEDQVLDAIEEAMRSQLLSEEKVGGAVMYDFAHALIRETLYEGLSLRRRMRLHQRVGESLETVYARNMDAVVEDLAFHFARGPQADVDKAVAYALRAAEKAQRVHAHEEAVKFYAETLDLLREAGRDAEAADVVEHLAEPTFLATGDREKATALLQEALAYFDRTGDRLRAAEVHRKIGRVLQLTDQFAQAIPHLRQALEVFEEAGNPHDVTRTLVELARAENFSGAFSDSETHARRAQELAVTHGMRSEEAMATAELGLIAHRHRNLDEARDLYERSIRLAEARTHPGDWLVLRRSTNNLGLIHQIRGDLDTATTLLEKALAISLEERNHPWTARARFTLAWYYLWTGDIERAKELWRKAADPREHADPDYAHAAATGLRLLDGDWEGADPTLREDLELARRAGDLQGQLGILNVLMRLTLDERRLEDGLRWAEEALAIYGRFSDFSLSPPAATTACMLLAVAGRVEEARSLHDQLEEFRVSGKGVFGLPYAALRRALIAAAEGRGDEVRAAYSESQEAFLRMGMTEEDAWAQYTLGRDVLARGGEDSLRPWARELLNVARATFQRIGLLRYVQEIDGLLADPAPLPADRPPVP
ncbi:MAG TPA: protein kinase [bacterium]|nr:protein kinase [bacterium]